MKDAFFLVTDELGWEDRFTANKLILPNLKVIHGEPSILQSFQQCKREANTELFILVDGDNTLMPEAYSALDAINQQAVFYASNKYGIKYGHGGVKVLSKDEVPLAGSSLDITSRLGIGTIKHVISSHDFDYSPFNTWKTVFKEMLKLYLWGDSIRLGAWLAHAEPKDIFTNSVLPFIKESTLPIVGGVIQNRELMCELHGRYMASHST